MNDEKFHVGKAFDDLSGEAAFADARRSGDNKAEAGVAVFVAVSLQGADGLLERATAADEAFLEDDHLAVGKGFVDQFPPGDFPGFLRGDEGGGIFPGRKKPQQAPGMVMAYLHFPAGDPDRFGDGRSDAQALIQEFGHPAGAFVGHRQAPAEDEGNAHFHHLPGEGFRVRLGEVLAGLAARQKEHPGRAFHQGLVEQLFRGDLVLFPEFVFHEKYRPPFVVEPGVTGDVDDVEGVVFPDHFGKAGHAAGVFEEEIDGVFFDGADDAHLFVFEPQHRRSVQRGAGHEKHPEGAVFGGKISFQPGFFPDDMHPGNQRGKDEPGVHTDQFER